MATEEQRHIPEISSRWAVGSLILVGLAASEISGAGTVAALPFIALTVLLSAICRRETGSRPIPAKRQVRSWRDLGDFLALWLEALAGLCASATCARIASATVDYMTEGKARVWLFGYESHSLGEPWPDVLGVTIILVVTAMFMLGLEYSAFFTALLNVGLATTLVYFIIMGSFHDDIVFWENDKFLPLGWSGLMTTAAMCTYGFVNAYPKKGTPYRCIKITSIIAGPFLVYCSVAIVFTMMTHFRELTGTAIPLVRVFEARDVDWARPVMASCLTGVCCLALMEICPGVYRRILSLAGTEWRILAKSLAYENQTTGSPVLAIFTAGSLSAILAFACPLSYLVRLLNVSPLLGHMIEISCTIYDRYQPFEGVDDSPVDAEVGYSKLRQGPRNKHGKERKSSGSAIKCLRTGLNFLPPTMRRSNQAIDRNKPKCSREFDEKECLLMGDYTLDLTENKESLESHFDANSESDGESESARTSDADADDSSTDIDAIVAEYRDKVKVATTMTGYSGTLKMPSFSSGRRVLVSSAAIFLSGLQLGFGIRYELAPLIWPCLIGLLMSALTIWWQPQRPAAVQEDGTPSYRAPLMPWLPVIAVCLNAVLASTLLPEVWPGILLWIFAGLVLFYRCDCCCWDCEPASHSIPFRRERVRLRPPPRGSVVSALVPSHRQRGRKSRSPSRLTLVDTVLISR